MNRDWSHTLIFGVVALACLALVAAKLALIWRLNVNWDEFYFLTHVYALKRNELTLLFQGGYTHLFTWLSAVPGTEIDEINAARVLMLVLLAVSAYLLWRIARRWTSPETAVFAPLCYLSMSPVLKHGASFRADSLLLPLTLATILLLTTEPARKRAVMGGGILLGASFALTVKAVLLLPTFVLLLLLSQASKAYSFGPVARSLLQFGCTAAGSAVLLLVVHKASLAPGPSTSTIEFASSAIDKTLLDIPFFPRRSYYYATRYTDSFAWTLLFVGAACAVLRPRYWRAAVCGLSLAPILFYRNAFPYYYVIMLAPASVLAAVAVDFLKNLLSPRLRPELSSAVLVAIAFALAARAGQTVYDLRFDGQTRQRNVIAAVHSIFPTPVPYIDHSGMISSFPKVNFFMSTWGIEKYRASGGSFMEPAIERHRPAFLLTNRAVLDPDAPASSRLFPRDTALIREHFLPYWGPVRVAGSSFTVTPRMPSEIKLPYPGSFRLESSAPVLINGALQRDGDLLDFSEVTVRLELPDGSIYAVEGRLAIGSAQPPPSDPAMHGSLYAPL